MEKVNHRARKRKPASEDGVPVAQLGLPEFSGSSVLQSILLLRGAPLDSLNVPRGALSFPGGGTPRSVRDDFRSQNGDSGVTLDPEIGFRGFQNSFCEVLASKFQISFEKMRTQCANHDDRAVTSRCVETVRAFSRGRRQGAQPFGIRRPRARRGSAACGSTQKQRVRS